jgi:hypothetical protein
VSGNVIEITVRVDDQASAKAAEIEQKLREISAAAAGGASAAIGVDLDDEGLRQKVVEAVQAAERNIAVIVGIDLEDEGLREKVVEAVQRAEKGLKVVVDADVRTDRIKDKLKEGADGGVEVPIEPDDTGFEEKVRRKTRSTKPDPVKVPVEPETDNFESEFRAAMDEADKAGGEAARSLQGSFSSMESGSRSLRAAMSELEPAAEGSGNALDDAGRKADNAGRGASSGGVNFGILANRSALLTAAALALGPALAAIPALSAAAGAGAATMALGFSGVIGALKDYGAQTQAAGQSAAQQAQTEFSNTIAIRNAQQAVADARRQAAVSAQNSADQVASAQEHLANAEQAEQVAQENLTQAWRDASNVLADLNNASADATNSVADAQLALQQAQQNATATVSSSLSTDLAKKQALQALVDAQQHLIDSQQKAKEAQQSADDANAKGVAGSTTVVQAQRAQAQAAQGVSDAQHALVVAQRNAADAQQQSAEQIQKAVQNLSDTYRQQQLAAAAAAESGSSAANKFAKDMAGLTPAAQAFVNQLISMKSGAKELSATAQTAMMPGLTQMLRDASPMLPVFNGAIRDMGTVIGNVAVQFGQLMQSPAFRGSLTQVFKEGAQFAQQFGSGLAGMFGGITAAAANAGPIVAGLGAGLHGLMVNGLPQLFQALTTNAQGIGHAFQGILTLVSNLGGPLGTIASALVGALGPALTQLGSPAMAQALQAIADTIAAILQVAGPLVTLLAQGLVGALSILAPLLQATAKFLQDNHHWLTPLLGLMAAWYAASKAQAAILAILNGEMTMNPIGLLIAAIAGLVIGLIYCWEHFKGFRDFVHQMMGDLHNWFFDAWHFIDGVWHAVAEGTDRAWQLIKSYMINPLVDAYHFVMQKFDDLKSFVKGLPGDLAKIGSGMWDWVSRGIGNVTATVSQGFHTLINDLIEGINWAIGYVNGATQKISDAWTWIPGASSSGIPGIPTIPLWKAAGGIAGGLSAIIGERGVELMHLPDGTQIMPHANTASAIATGAAGGGGGVGRLQIEWIGGSGGDEVMTWLRKNIRIRAGAGPNSVQRALGQVS